MGFEYSNIYFFIQQAKDVTQEITVRIETWEGGRGEGLDKKVT